MLFNYPQYNPALLKFADRSADNNAIWGAVLEKAWAKVKGNYLISEGGLIVNGLRALTGVPVFSYNLGSFTTVSDLSVLYNLLKSADDAGYIMGASTDGGGDSNQNVCGIAESHAYTILAAFTMTDNGVSH